MNNTITMNETKECKALSSLTLQNALGQMCLQKSELKFIFDEEKLKPLPIYISDDPLAPPRMCRSAAFNQSPKCKYCYKVETSYIPLPRSSFGLSCLPCYKQFRIGYMSMLDATCQEDTAELREKFITEFKTRTKLWESIKGEVAWSIKVMLLLWKKNISLI